MEAAGGSQGSAGAAAAAAAAPAPAPAPSRPSLADWKAGQVRMTTASAGEHVAKTAPKEKPRPPAPGSKKARQQVVRDKPWAERTQEERFGTKPKQLPVPMPKQVRDVLRYLESNQERPAPIPWEEIVAEGIPPWYDTAEGGELYNLVIANPRVTAAATGFAYRSEHGVADKASLLRHIRAHPEGVRSSDIKDGYDNVLRDADTLHAEGSVFKFYHGEFKVDVFFPAPEAGPSLPAEFVETYLQTRLPPEPTELVSGLGKLGVRSALASASSLRKPVSMIKADRPKKKARRMQVRHMTNVHLAQLLTGAEAQKYDRIDR